METKQNGKREISKLDTNKINESLSNQELRGESLHGISRADGFAAMEQMDSSQLEELTSQYLNFDTKGKHYFVFLGMDKATIDGKQIEVVKLEDKNGVTFINGNAVLVNSLKRVENLPCYVRVDYVGDEKSANGTYKNLKVYTFPMNAKPNKELDKDRAAF